MLVEKDAIIPNSLSVPSRASFVLHIQSKEQILEACDFAEEEGLPLIPLGDGTNIVPNNYMRGVVAILDTKGLKLDENGYLKVEAGENWDNTVLFSIQNDFTGLEALSAIPGKAGAAPIQNIGAYGSEIADCLQKVEVYDRDKKEFVFLNKTECGFGYRDSVFKKHPEKFIVVSLILKLSKEDPKIPDYKDVKNYFNEKGNVCPTLQEIRDLIISIRKTKLPDPNLIPNAGSFFKNPVATKELAGKIREQFPDLISFPFKNKIKLSAGWLIGQTGFKGGKIGKIEIYKNNALVLTNPNKVGFKEIEFAENFIKKEVFAKFGINLEREPRIIG